jgi:hypothetical protein
MRGLFASSLAAPAYLEAAAWLPLGALAVLEVAGGRLARGAALLATATAMSFLAGYPQPTTYMLLVWASLGVVAMLAPGAPARGRWTTAAVLAGGVALGTTAAASDSPRARRRRASRPTRGHVALRPIAGTLPTRAMIAGGAFAWGVTAIALGATAVLGRRTRALAAWALVMTGLTVAIALGEGTPLFGIYRPPFLGSFRFPDRMLGATDLVFGIAAAIGFDVVRDRGARGARSPWWRSRWRSRWPPSPSPAARRRSSTRGVILFASAAAAWCSDRRSHRPIARVATIGLVVLVAAELFAQPWRQMVVYTPHTVERYDRFASPAGRGASRRRARGS